MIHDLPTWAMALLVSVGFVGVTVLALLPVNRLWPVLARHAHNEIAGFIIAVVGVLYAVLLASIAILALENLRDADLAVQREAFVLGDLYRDSAFLPVPAAGPIRSELRSYGEVVVNEEWAAMQAGRKPEAGWPILERLQAQLFGLEPSTKLAEIALQQYLSRLDDLYDARRDRLFAAFRGVEPVVWGVVLSGAFATLAFSLFFGVEDLRAHMAMGGLLAFSLSLIIVLIIAVDEPLRGSSQVSSEPFQFVLQQFDRLDAARR